MTFFARLRNWLIVGIPAAIGIAIAVVMRKKPVPSPAETPVARGPDMTPADNNARELEREQAVLADQHAAIEDVLKPKPVVIQPEKPLEDAVAAYNRDK